MGVNTEVSGDTAKALVLTSLESVLEARDLAYEKPLGDATRLIGREAVLDSLGLVTLLVDLEESVEDEWGLSITLADERAMSRKQSPFRSVETLTAYLLELAEEEAGDRS